MKSGRQLTIHEVAFLWFYCKPHPSYEPPEMASEKILSLSLLKSAALRLDLSVVMLAVFVFAVFLSMIRFSRNSQVQ